MRVSSGVSLDWVVREGSPRHRLQFRTKLNTLAKAEPTWAVGDSSWQSKTFSEVTPSTCCAFGGVFSWRKSHSNLFRVESTLAGAHANAPLF